MRSFVSFLFFGLLISSIGYSQNLVEVGARGRDGENARSGQDADQNRPGADRNGNGFPGRHGGDAGRASAGENAYDVWLEVWQEGSDAQDRMFRFRGELRNEQTGRSSPINEQRVAIGSQGLVVVLGRGGRGGNGGAAGRGQPGGNAQGESRRATAQSDAERGRDGGDAGDAGNPSDGERGGRGARVTFAIREGQEHLVSLLGFDSNSVAGGAGGEAGKGISQREAAAGGNPTKGGEGFTHFNFEWREDGKIYKAQNVRLPQRPPGAVGNETNMNLTFTNVADPNDRIQREQNVPYARPAGPDGRPGRNGRPSQMAARSGQSGDAGGYQIRVLDLNGRPKEAFESPFVPALLDAQISESDGNQVFEPGERVQVRFVVANQQTRGKQMSLPANAIQINVSESGLVGDGARGVNVPTIAPGERATTEALEYQIEPANFSQANQDGMEFRVTATGHMIATGRTLSGFSAQKSLRVSLPIRFEGMHGLKNLKPGEAAWYELRFKNRSARDLDVGRALETALAWTNSSLDPANVVLVDQDMNRIEFSPQNSWLQKLPPIKANSELVVRVAIGLRSESKPDQMLRVIPSMNLQQVSGEGRSAVTGDAFELQVGGSFEFSQDSDVVLVVPAEVAPHEIATLTSYFQSIGLKPSIYRLANEAIFSMARPVSSGGLLKDHLRGKSVFIFDANGSFQEQEIFEAAAQGTNVSIISNKQADLRIERMLQRSTLGVRSGAEIRGIDNIVKAVEALKNQATGEFVSYIPVDSFVFTSPGEDDIQKAANKVLELLDVAFPGRKFELIYDFNPVKTGGLISRKYELGTIKITRVLDKAASRVLGLAQSSKDVISSNKVLQQTVLYGLSINQLLKTIQHLQSSAAGIDQLSVLQVAIDALHFRILKEISNVSGGDSVVPYSDRAALLAQLIQSKWPRGTQLNLNETAWASLLVSLKAASIIETRIDHRSSEYLNRAASEIYRNVLEANGGRTPYSDIERQALSLVQRNRWKQVSELESYMSASLGLASCFHEGNCYVDPKERVLPEKSGVGSLAERAAQVAKKNEELRSRLDKHEGDRRRQLIEGGCEALLQQAKNSGV